MTGKDIKFKILILFLVLTIPAGLSLADTSSGFQLKVNVNDYQPSWLNALDSHEWIKTDYNTFVTTQLNYTEKAGQRALQAIMTNSDASPQWSVIRVNQFIDPEDWSAVTQVKCDVYVETTSTDDKTIQLELQTVNAGLIQRPQVTITQKNTWVSDVTWNLGPISEPVGTVFLTPNHIEGTEHYYFRNLRIVRSGIEEPWDTLRVPSYQWQGSMDFKLWRPPSGGYAPRNEPITHNQTYNNSAGALSIPWDASIDSTNNYAKMEATNLYGFDFTAVQHFQVKVYSDKAGLKLRMDFWDGANYASTNELDITTIGGWQTLTWNKPGGPMNWVSLKSLIFMVNTSVGGTGHVYIDEMEFLNN